MLPVQGYAATGLYSHNHHVLTNSRPLGGVQRFDDSSSLATWLHDSGYRTGLVGKYFNNYGSDNDPTTPVDDVGYVPPGWTDWQGLMDDAADGLRAFQMYNYTINDNGRLVKHGTAASDYQTDVIAAGRSSSSSSPMRSTMRGRSSCWWRRRPNTWSCRAPS